jgi:hypothetical protein
MAAGVELGLAHLALYLSFNIIYIMRTNIWEDIQAGARNAVCTGIPGYFGIPVSIPVFWLITGFAV